MPARGMHGYVGVAELVDALALGASGATRGGSSPLADTRIFRFL